MVSLLIHILVLAAGIAFLAAGLMYIFDPRLAHDLLKKFGVGVIGLSFGLTLGQQLLQQVVGTGDFVWALVLLALSALAYVIREARNKKVRRPMGQGGRERTPMILPHFPEEEE